MGPQHRLRASSFDYHRRAPVAVELEARLRRWVNWKLDVYRRRAVAAGQPIRERDPKAFTRLVGDGITAFGLGPDQAERLLRYATTAAERRRAKRAGGGDGEADVDPLTLLRTLDETDPDWWQAITAQTGEPGGDRPAETM